VKAAQGGQRVHTEMETIIRNRPPWPTDTLYRVYVGYLPPQATLWKKTNTTGRTTRRRVWYLVVQQGELAPRTQEHPSQERVGTSMLTQCTLGFEVAHPITKTDHYDEGGSAGRTSSAPNPKGRSPMPAMAWPTIYPRVIADDPWAQRGTAATGVPPQPRRYPPG
jgi:hypothetical protein